MDTETGAGKVTVNRWWRIAGALLMNLPLGALYAWSIFVLPLEQEFGWTRTDTSWVFTIAARVRIDELPVTPELILRGLDAKHNADPA